MADIVPWGPQPNEGSKPFRAFAIYRDLGPAGRSLDAVAWQLRGDVAESSQRPPGRRLRSRRLQMWSRDWRWVERAAAWDAHVDQQVQWRLIDAAVEMAKRHALQARALQDRAVRRLMELNPAELAPADVLKWMVAGCKLEAQSMETLMALTAPAATYGAATIPAAGPSIIITRTATPPALLTPEPDQEPSPDVRALPFVPATAMAG